MAVVLVKNLVL